MREEESFQEMMKRYNRELYQMQEKARSMHAVPAIPLPEAMLPDGGESRKTWSPCAQDPKEIHSLSAGPDGPVLAQDTLLHETLGIFVHSKLLERAVHVKGYGAFGSFRPFQSMKEVTCAGFLQDPNRSTPVFVRFSLAGSSRGAPDTARDIRGFAVKFYTAEGNYDLVGNHIPVFFVQDAIRFPETIAALAPSPVNNLPDPQRFWSFIARSPETIHMITWLYSDAGTVDSFRKIRGYGVNTYVWKNADGARRYVKYHWIPVAGERTISREEALRLASENPNVAGQDLYDTLASGIPVEYDLCVQLMDLTEAGRLSYDPLDDTKVWSEEQFPLRPVGRLTLSRNPENYREQVEKAAFSPANLVDGIELSADKMLQGRSFIYWDAQRRRLGPDFREIAVNRSPGWNPAQSLITSGEGEKISGTVGRQGNPEPDYFTQAGERWDSLPDLQKEHLAENIALELRAVTKDVRECVLGYFREASAEFGDAVAQRIPAP